MRNEAGGWLLGAAVAGAGAAWLWRHQDEVMTRRPVNEWTFTHMNLLMPTEDVRRGGNGFPLPRRPRPSTLDGTATSVAAAGQPSRSRAA